MFHVACHIKFPRGIVCLEIQPALKNDPEESSAGIKPKPAEHALARHGWHVRQLIEHKVFEGISSHVRLGLQQRFWYRAASGTSAECAAERSISTRPASPSCRRGVGYCGGLGLNRKTCRSQNSKKTGGWKYSHPPVLLAVFFDSAIPVVLPTNLPASPHPPEK